MSALTRRWLFADTETTGLDAKGERIIEIGLIEYVDRKPTGINFHVYLNPEKEIDSVATAIHGMTWDDLREQPLFGDVAQDVADFVKGAEVVAHNADFDMKFLDAEFERAGLSIRMNHLCTVTDTLLMARQKHPGQRLSLDSLCEKYGVNNKGRELHGALLDAQLLAEVYLGMTSGQDKLDLSSIPESANDSFAAALGVNPDARPVVIEATPDEIKVHLDRMSVIAKKSGRQVWDGPAL